MKVSELLLADPFSDTPIGPEDLGLLVNRQAERDRLEDVLRGAAAGYPQNVALLGEDGMGKTSLVNYLEAASRIQPGLYPCRIDLVSGTTESTLILTLIQSLLDQLHFDLGSHLLSLVGLGRETQARQIQARLEGTLGAERGYTLQTPLVGLLSVGERRTEQKGRPGDLAETLRLLEQVMKLLAPGLKTVLILIDEGQYVARQESAALLQRLRLLFQRRPYMVAVAGSPRLFSLMSEIEPTFNNLFPEHNRLRLQGMGAAHLEELLRARLLPVRRREAAGIEPFPSTAPRILAQESGGNPRYCIRIASSALYLARNEESLKEAHLLEASWHIQAERGRDLFDRADATDQQLLEAVARQPNLTFSELARAMGWTTSRVSRRVQQMEELGYLETVSLGKGKSCRLQPFLDRFLRTLEGIGETTTTDPQKRGRRRR